METASLYPLWLVDSDEINDAAILAQSWNYPREIMVHEIEDGWWFSFGPDVVWWFENRTDMPGWSGLHMSTNPEFCDRPLYARRVLRSVQTAACLFGIERLYVCEAPAKVTEYVKRLGFQRDELGYYWEVRHGRT